MMTLDEASFSRWLKNRGYTDETVQQYPQSVRQMVETEGFLLSDYIPERVEKLLGELRPGNPLFASHLVHEMAGWGMAIVHYAQYIREQRGGPPQPTYGTRTFGILSEKMYLAPDALSPEEWRDP